MQKMGFDVFTAIDTVLDNQAISLETHKKLTIMINEMLLTDAEVAQKKSFRSLCVDWVIAIDIDIWA